MDDQSTATPSKVFSGVAYKGDAADLAQALDDVLRGTLGDRVRPLEELPTKATKLGIGIVLVTIVATAAMKALVKIAVDRIEEALESRRTQNNDTASLQVRVKLPEGKRQYFPRAGPTAITGEYSWKLAFETIRELISIL